MPKNIWVHRVLTIIPRIVVWPILWYDIRRRRLGKKQDEWHPLDLWLVSHGHVVKTFGYFFWERPKFICWWCLGGWVLFLTLIGIGVSFASV